MKLPKIKFLIIAVLVFTFTQASAHAPVIELSDSSPSSPIPITWSLDISIAIYGHFENRDDVDVVAFVLTDKEARAGIDLYVHTLVPACSPYRDLLPTVAVVGPRQWGLQGNGTASQIPFTTDNGDGLALLKNDQQGPTWYEPFSGKNYFWQNSMSVPIARTGHYFLYIWSPQRLKGDYVLAIGSQEHWGLREIGRAFRHMPDLVSNREIHNETCRMELEGQAPSKNPLPGK